jgi:hypothetical protein
MENVYHAANWCMRCLHGPPCEATLLFRYSGPGH